MIIQKQKPIEEILESLKDCRKVFIAGCADCATACKTGGEEELAELKTKLTEAGKTITGMAVYDTACLSGEVRKTTAAHQPEVDEADTILVMACGSGVQTLGDYLDTKPVVPGVDPLFIGQVIRAGKYEEKCQACGKCVLALTDGICPVTRCSKGLINGPCGGYKDGKCEVDPEKDCAWVLIYERLKARGHLDKLRELQDPKDHSALHRPQRLVWERPKKKVVNKN